MQFQKVLLKNVFVEGNHSYVFDGKTLNPKISEKILNLLVEEPQKENIFDFMDTLPLPTELHKNDRFFKAVFVFCDKSDENIKTVYYLNFLWPYMLPVVLQHDINHSNGPKYYLWNEKYQEVFLKKRSLLTHETMGLFLMANMRQEYLKLSNLRERENYKKTFLANILTKYGQRTHELIDVLTKNNFVYIKSSDLDKEMQVFLDFIKKYSGSDDEKQNQQLLLFFISLAKKIVKKRRNLLIDLFEKANRFKYINNDSQFNNVVDSDFSMAGIALVKKPKLKSKVKSLKVKEPKPKVVSVKPPKKKKNAIEQNANDAMISGRKHNKKLRIKRRAWMPKNDEPILSIKQNEYKVESASSGDIKNIQEVKLSENTNKAITKEQRKIKKAEKSRNKVNRNNLRQDKAAKSKTDAKKEKHITVNEKIRIKQEKKAHKQKLKAIYQNKKNVNKPLKKEKQPKRDRKKMSKKAKIILAVVLSVVLLIAAAIPAIWFPVHNYLTSAIHLSTNSMRFEVGDVIGDDNGNITTIKIKNAKWLGVNKDEKAVKISEWSESDFSVEEHKTVLKDALQTPTYDANTNLITIKWDESFFNAYKDVYLAQRAPYIFFFQTAKFTIQINDLQEQFSLGFGGSNDYGGSSFLTDTKNQQGRLSRGFLSVGFGTFSGNNAADKAIDLDDSGATAGFKIQDYTKEWSSQEELQQFFTEDKFTYKNEQEVTIYKNNFNSYGDFIDIKNANSIFTKNMQVKKAKGESDAYDLEMIGRNIMLKLNDNLQKTLTINFWLVTPNLVLYDNGYKLYDRQMLYLNPATNWEYDNAFKFQIKINVQ